MTNSQTEKFNTQRKYCPKCYQQFEGSVENCPDDGAILRGPHNDPLIGKVFAEKYEVESVLGLGGMSIVYKAKHRLMNRTVAIKMLHSNLKDDIISLERFKLEAQAASSLSHQNIITVYDFGVTPDGEPYFVMDCLEGESLRELIDRKGKLPYQRALPIFKQICDALDAAHKTKIVHRDLKPANVILLKQDDSGKELVKLVDFGIAKFLPASGKHAQQLTRTGEVFGSPIYMSPEQCTGKELDTRSDIYALGCLMYETLAGTPPFVGQSFLETMNMHVSQKAKPIKSVASDADVPPSLEQIVLRCMSKDPADRFQTAGEISDLLAALSLQLLGASGMQRGVLSGKVQSVMPCPKLSRAYSAVAILACLLLGCISFLAFWPGPPEDRGTPLGKLTWQIILSNAVSATNSGDYEHADALVRQADTLARGFGDDKARLEATLRREADLYNRWEGHAQRLEKVNAEMADIQKMRVKREAHAWMKLLHDLEEQQTSAVARTNTKLKAEAQIPGIITTSGKLSGNALWEENSKLLTKALEVETKLLGSDSLSLAQLQTRLADCLVQLREFPRIRPLLKKACRLYKNNRANDEVQFVRSLNKLGQYDLDQNSFTDAKDELDQALDDARKLNNKDVLILCLRSDADMLRQTKKDDESKKLYHEADILEKGEH
jgi:serine/threonine-protein kinase